MADYRTSDAALDASLAYISSNCDRQVAVSADPLNYAGIAAVTLAAVAMTGVDFTLAAGDVSGRKLQVARKTGITPAANGNATHILLVDDTAQDILLMLPVPDTALSTAVVTDFAGFEHEMRVSEGA